MTLEQFQNWALSQGSVAKTDGGYIGECVSLINQYLSKVYGLNAGAWGHAKDWATNPNVLALFDKVGSPQAGDIGVSGAVPTNPYGHIWIYLSPNTIIEQNGRISRRVSVGSAYSNPIAILRRKGTPPQGVVKMNQEDANMVAISVMHVDPKTVSTAYFIGDAPKDALYKAMQTPQGKEITKRVQQWEAVNYERDALKAQSEQQAKDIEALKKALADAGGNTDDIVISRGFWNGLFDKIKTFIGKG